MTTVLEEEKTAFGYAVVEVNAGVVSEVGFHRRGSRIEAVSRPDNRPCASEREPAFREA